MKIPRLTKPEKSKTRQQQIEERLAQMPKECQRTYLKAVERRSMAAAVKSFCCECMGWNNYIEEIHRCTDCGCPMWMYRPYRLRCKAKITHPSAVESTNSMF